MSSPTQHQPTSFINRDGRIGVQAGQYNVYGTSIVQQSQDPLSQLPNATEAPIYSSAKQHEPLCLSGTRKDLLDKIESWADGQDERCIFWLSGLAGTGKSTIARTVAHRYYYEKKRLAASFFFSRGGGEDVRCANKFVTSLAIQLAHNVEASKQLISEAIIKRDDIANHSLSEQWHHLILGPLSKLSDSSCPASLVLVVDALDECENEDDICLIVHLLAEVRSLTKVRLRVLLTGRPEAPIRSEFSRLQQKHQVVLHDMPQSVVDQDIILFLKHEFEDYRQKEEIDDDWPSPEAIGSLVQKASGLFIWAATAYRFVCGGMDIEERLRMLLEGERHERSPEAHLDSIYVTVLQASVPGGHNAQEKQKHYQDLRTLLGSIVTLFSPLSVEALSKVLRFPKMYTNRMLRSLHAILAIPADNTQLLRLHHPSFRDFLLRGDRCNDANFVVVEKAAHQHLAMKCLQLLSSSLQQGACGVDAVGTLVTKNEGFKPCLPSELQYACHYWIRHLVRGDAELLDGDEVHVFLQEHFLHWLEALGWMGKVPEGIHAIRSLESMTLKCRELREFVHDMRRFALYSRAAIEQAPLQVYCSGLAFAPSGSIVKKQFTSKMPRWIKKVTQIDSHWNAVLQTLEGRSNGVMAFSPDGNMLASASYDMAIKVWDIGTGALLQTLGSHLSNITQIIFSPDSKTLASYSSTVKLWNAWTGELLQWSSGDVRRITDMAFSPDSKVLALLSWDGRILLANVGMGNVWHVVECSGYYPLRVTFSPEGTALALVSDGAAAGILDVRTGKVMATAERDDGTPVAFSPDAKIFATVSRTETIKLWDASTGAILHTLRGHVGRIAQLVFSPDGTMLASASHSQKLMLWWVNTGGLATFPLNYSNYWKAPVFSPNRKALAFISSKVVKLWRAETGLLHIFEGHQDLVRALAFSPDGKVLASASDDGAIKLWDAGADMVGKATKGSFGRVTEMAFSPDGEMLASTSRDGASTDRIIKLWDVRSGSERETMHSLYCSVVEVAFSPDSKMLASISYDMRSEDSTIDLWKVDTTEAPQRLGGHSRRISAIAFSPDSMRLASASWDGTVKLWDISTGAVRTLEYHFGVITGLAFSPDATLLALVSIDGGAALWDVSQGKMQRTFIRHISDVRAVAFSPDGKVLASLAVPSPSPYHTIPHIQEVKLWDVSTGDLLQTLQSHPYEFSPVPFSPDLEVPVLESGNGTRNMWDTNLGTMPQSHPADATLSMLSDFGHPVFLHTHLGAIPTGFSFSKSSPKLTSPPEVFISEQWIYYRGFRVLWLPPEYRATCVAVYDDLVAIGRSFGVVSLLEISDRS